ncbi:hypothetical protein B0H13DRAFT_2531188 [Mycena leptocephala]|nr:hypothetical protein B0H13DRAFT_2531188 [Mycena leptocephala]
MAGYHSASDAITFQSGFPKFGVQSASRLSPPLPDQRASLSSSHPTYFLDDNMSESGLILPESSPAGIERLPPENLAEIFTLCLPSGRWASYDPNIEKAPWVLAHVCSHWRAVALSTPRLWRTLDVDLSQLLPDEIDPNDNSSSAGGPSDEIDINDSSGQNLIHLVGLFLERSGTCPFSLIFSWEDHEPCELHPVLSQVVEMLTRASHRWEKVSYQLPLSVLVNLPSVKGRVQSLRSVDIWPRLTGDEGGVIDEFEDAPLLQTVDMFMWQSPTAAPVVLFSTSFRIFPTLRTMPNIVVCDITYDPLPLNGTEDDPEDLAKIPLLHLAHLRNLTVRHSAPEASTSGYLAQLADRLTLPQLENLEVHCDNEVFPHLTELLVRSACQLRTFSVHGTQFNDAVFAFFAYVPTLTELTLGSIVFTVAEAVWLTRPTPPVPCPLPALRVLNMEFAQLPAAAFVQMIESRVDDARSAGDACLEALRVTNIVLDRNTHLLLLALRRPGLRVTVVDQYDRELELDEENEKEREEDEREGKEDADTSWGSFTAVV